MHTDPEEQGVQVSQCLWVSGRFESEWFKKNNGDVWIQDFESLFFFPSSHEKSHLYYLSCSGISFAVYSVFIQIPEYLRCFSSFWR